MSVPIVGTA